MRPNAAMMNMTTTSESPQVADHVTFAEALTKDAVFKQDYKCVVVWADVVKDITLKDGTGTKKVQDLKLDDGTAAIKYALWGGGQIKVGQGVEITQAYIKKNAEGYYDLKVAQTAKGGSVKITPTSDVVPSKKPDAAGETGTIAKAPGKDAVIKIPVPAVYAAKWIGKEVECKNALNELFVALWNNTAKPMQEKFSQEHAQGLEAIDWDPEES